MAYIAAYSSITDWLNCPYKFYHRHITRQYPFEENENVVWGRTVHESMERAIRYGSPLPDSMLPYAKYVSAVKMAPKVLAEVKYAIAEDGTARAWTANGCWLRGKLDAVTFSANYKHAYIPDWKTGKAKEDPFELEIQALLLKINMPTVETIKACYVWFKEDRVGLTYTINDPLITVYPKVKVMIRDIHNAISIYSREKPEEVFKQTPNGLCDYCMAPGCPHAAGSNP